MADAVELTVRLVDRVTGPATKATRSIRGIERASRRVNRSAGVDRLTAGMGQFQAASARATGGLGSLIGKAAALGAIALAARAVARAVIGIAVAFGRAVIGAVEFLQRSRLAFSLLVKGGKNSNQVLQEVVQLAATLGLDVKETTKAFQKLLASQFSVKLAKDVIKFTADLQAIGASADEVSRTILAITQIKTAGILKGQELRQLAEAGVSNALIYEALAKRLNKTVDEVKKLQNAGKILADDAIAAIGEAIKKKAGIKEFGEAAKKATQTLGGLGTQIKLNLNLLLLRLADKIMPAVEKSILPVLKDIIKAFKSPEAKAFIDKLAAGLSRIIRIIGAFGKIVAAAVGGFIRGMQKARGVTDSVAGATDELSAEQIAELAVKAGEAAAKVGALVGKLLKMLDALERISSVSGGAGGGPFGAQGFKLPKLDEQGKGIGLSLTGGMQAGINQGKSSVIAAAQSMAGSAVSAAKKALGIASPSKVFEGFGQLSALGFSEGVEGGGAGIPGISARAVTPAVGGGRSSSLSQTNNFNTTVNESEGATATAREVRRQQLLQMASALEQAALELGAA